METRNPKSEIRKKFKTPNAEIPNFKTELIQAGEPEKALQSQLR
jgi:hypothetical protein